MPKEALPSSTLRRWRTYSRCTHSSFNTFHPYLKSQYNYTSRAPSALDIPRLTLPKGSTAGRLRHFQQNWQRITQDEWVLETVAGYRIPFTHNPRQSSRPPSHTSSEEISFIEDEIQSILQVGAIKELQTTPQEAFFSTIFTVPKKGGGRRPIINLKYLNKFLPHLHFKMEGIPTVQDVITPGDFMFKLDLKDAYFMIPVAEDHQNVPIIPKEREMLSLYMSSIRSINSPLGIYQGDPPSGAVPQIQRCENGDLPR